MQLTVGKKYERYDDRGLRVAFSFGEMVGKFTGMDETGTWAKFDIGKKKTCMCLLSDCTFKETE
jgi:hypothetical protein